MKFKVLTISKHTPEYGFCIEGLTVKNQYFRYFQGTYGSGFLDLFEEKEHLITYAQIRYAYRRNKDLYFFRDIEIEDSILKLIRSKETENIRLAIELIRNKKG